MLWSDPDKHLARTRLRLRDVWHTENFVGECTFLRATSDTREAVLDVLADMAMRIMYSTGNSIYAIPTGCLVEHDVIWRSTMNGDASTRHTLRVPEWLRIVNEHRLNSRP